MFTIEASLDKAARTYGRKKAIQLVGDINGYTRRYGPDEPDDEPVEAPNLHHERCLLDFNEHFIELSNREAYPRSMTILLVFLAFVIPPAIPAMMVIASATAFGLNLLTIFLLLVLMGALTPWYFLWPVIVAPVVFTSLRARYRFNRTTGKVYVLRPKRYGGNVVLDWHRVQAHVHWRSPGPMKKYSDLHNQRLWMLRQRTMEYPGLVLYWPPFDVKDPHRKGEDIVWVGPSSLFGSSAWRYLRTFMEKGMDAVPMPCEENWLRKGFSNFGEAMRENKDIDPLFGLGTLLWWPVRSLTERLCHWPTFPEEWCSDCGQQRRESGTGPEAPLRWQAGDSCDPGRETPEYGAPRRAGRNSDIDHDTGRIIDDGVSSTSWFSRAHTGTTWHAHARMASQPSVNVGDLRNLGDLVEPSDVGDLGEVGNLSDVGNSNDMGDSIDALVGGVDGITVFTTDAGCLDGLTELLDVFKD